MIAFTSRSLHIVQLSGAMNGRSIAPKSSGVRIGFDIDLCSEAELCPCPQSTRPTHPLAYGTRECLLDTFAGAC